MFCIATFDTSIHGIQQLVTDIQIHCTGTKLHLRIRIQTATFCRRLFEGLGPIYLILWQYMEQRNIQIENYSMSSRI